ncbi:Uma2 family endonuclease [Myxococcota bacterium]
MGLPAEVLAETAATQNEDRFVVLNGVEWKTYCAVRELFDSPGTRMTYLRGALEIMSPSRRHEAYKTSIARLIELFALERDVPLFGYGSTTFRRALAERGLEPDECYVVGREMSDDEYPDIALEVVLTSGGINKLEVYRGLGVLEVWFWQQGQFSVFRLGDSGYERKARSGFLPSLDFEELARFAADLDQHAALKGYRDALRGQQP